MFIRDDTDIKKAVNEWCSDPITAKSKYGDISDWDTSAVTSMEHLFDDKEEFNHNISRWDVSNVKNMSNMFNKASSLAKNEFIVMINFYTGCGSLSV